MVKNIYYLIERYIKTNYKKKNDDTLFINTTYIANVGISA